MSKFADLNRLDNELTPGLHRTEHESNVFSPLGLALSACRPFGVVVRGGDDTVEVCGSSPHGPTISFSELASTTSLRKAPIGSIREAVRNYRGHFLSILRHMYSF